MFLKDLYSFFIEFLCSSCLVLPFPSPLVSRWVHVIKFWLMTLCNTMGCSLPGSSVHGDSPGKNTRVGCHAFLQGIFPTQGSNLGLPHCRWILYYLSQQGSPDIWFTDTFLQSIACLFLLLTVSFTEQKFLTFMTSTWSVFFFLDHALGEINVRNLITKIVSLIFF